MLICMQTNAVELQIEFTKAEDLKMTNIHFIAFN